MIRIRALKELNSTDFKRIVSGYISKQKYEVDTCESEDNFSINLRLIALEKPFIKNFAHFDAETVENYDRIAKENFSFGAYDGDTLIGLAIAEPQTWNKSLFIHEFHVAKSHRCSGIGKRLMECAAEKARSAKLRIIICETQNTNVPAIEFYRKLGFVIEGVDISLYSNADYPNGEIAIFMKRRLI